MPTLDELIERNLSRAAVLIDGDEQELFTEDNPAQVGGDVAVTGRVISDTYVEGVPVDDDRPMPTDQIVQAEGVWVEMMDVRLDDDPTSFLSKPYQCDEESGLRVYIFIDSTLAPTDVRIVAEHSFDYGRAAQPTWAPMEEGFWASLFWEDQDTADGIWRNFLLPVAGEDWVRFYAVATGTDATNYFDVRIIVRAFRGHHTAPHA